MSIPVIGLVVAIAEWSGESEAGGGNRTSKPPPSSLWTLLSHAATAGPMTEVHAYQLTMALMP